MSNRRGAHARVGVTDAGVPRELLELDSPYWQSEQACLGWLSKRGIRVHSHLSFGDWNPRYALKTVISAWAIASGHSNPDYPQLPDTRFLVASGLARVQQQCARQRLRYIGEAE